MTKSGKAHTSREEHGLMSTFKMGKGNQVLLLYKKEGDYMENLVPKVLAVEQHKGKFRTIYKDVEQYY